MEFRVRPLLENGEGSPVRDRMQIYLSYARLFISSVLLMGGLAILFLPTQEMTDRNNRWREKQLQTVPINQRGQWVEDQDAEDSRTYASLRLFGVLLGGLGLTGVLHETAYLIGRYVR